MANTLAEMEALMKTSTAQVIGNINDMFTGYKKETFELAKMYAVSVKEGFRAIQLHAGKNVRGAFWTNRTSRAADRWYTRAFRLTASRSIGFSAHQSNTLTYASALEEWVKSGTGMTSTQIMINKYAYRFRDHVEDIIQGKKVSYQDIMAEEF